MAFLPIVERELRVASRRRGTYIWRCVAALGVVLIGAWLNVVLHTMAPAQLAQSLFSVLSGAALLYGLLAGIQFTSDSLSREKREGTLGLLFLTDLKGYDVVLGKLAATSLNALYGLIAILPVLAIPLLMGGVSIGNVWRMSLVALNALLFSLSVGLCVSALGRSARTCASVTFLLIATFTVLSPLFGSYLSYKYSWTAADDWFAVPSVGYAFAHAFESRYVMQPYKYWASMGVVHLLTWLFLFLAVVTAPRSWQDRPAKSGPGSLKRIWTTWRYGSSSRRIAFRSRLLDINPFFWMTSRVQSKPAEVWIGMTAMALAWLAGYLEFRNDWLEVPVYVMTVMLLNMVFKLWFNSECTRELAEQKQSGALELLVTTPLSVRQIIEGQRLSLQRQFLVPLLLVLFVQGVCTIAAYNLERSPGDKTMWLSLGFCSMILLVADVIALFSVGLWASARIGNPQRAALIPVLGVLVLPWLLFGLGLMFVAAYAISHPGFNPGESFLVWLWFLPAIAVDVLLTIICRNRFLSDFRSFAAGSR